MATSNTLKWMNSTWIKRETRNLQRLGGGSFGSVYRFTDPATNSQKALKVVEYETARALEKISNNKELIFDDWVIQSKKEFENLKLLGNCEYILNLEYYLVDYDNECIYLITNLASDCLTALIEDPGKKLSAEEIKKILFCILSALKHAHGKNITHRDIKPDNVLVDASGNYLLCDWGVSRRMTLAGSQAHNTSPMGTAAYLAPDILDVADAKAKGKTISVDLFKCDIYSTGLTIIVCCGLPEKRLMAIPKDEEEEHDEKKLV